MTNHLPKKQKKALEALLPKWATYETKMGKKHVQLWVGDQMVGVMPFGSHASSSESPAAKRKLMNSAKQIIRAHKGRPTRKASDEEE